MRATEIIRNVLDLIDQIDQTDQQEPVEIEPQIQNCSDDPNRFLQIVDLLTSEYNQMYDNSPNETISGIESVTTHAGGGWMGPKNPADIRADSVAMYPAFIAKK